MKQTGKSRRERSALSSFVQFVQFSTLQVLHIGIDSGFFAVSLSALIISGEAGSLKLPHLLMNRRRSGPNLPAGNRYFTFLKI